MLNKPITVHEVITSLTRMNKNASPGVFGLDISTLKILFKNEPLANNICSLLNRWVFERDCSTELFLALLSAIPK